MKLLAFVSPYICTPSTPARWRVPLSDVMEKAHATKMPAVAITDHGNMFGAIEFIRAAQEHGNKPIYRLRGVRRAGQPPRQEAANCWRDAASHLFCWPKMMSATKLIKLVPRQRIFEGILLQSPD